MDLNKIYKVCSNLNGSCTCENNNKGQFCQALPDKVFGINKETVEVSTDREIRRIEANRVTAKPVTKKEWGKFYDNK